MPVIAGIVFVIIAIFQWAGKLSLDHAFDIFTGVLGILLILGAMGISVSSWPWGRRQP